MSRLAVFLQLTYQDQHSDYILLSVVNTVQPSQAVSAGPAPTSTRQFQVTTSNFLVFRNGPPASQPTTINQVQVFTHDATTDTAFPVFKQIPPVWHKETNTFTLNLDVAFTDAPQPGSLIRIDYNKDQLWLTVQKRNLLSEDDAALHTTVEIEGTGFWPLNTLPGNLPQQLQADLLSFELWARREGTDPLYLSDLAFNAAHPRFWGALPTDEQVYADTGRPVENSHAAPWQEAAHMYFPLARDNSHTEDTFFFPIAMPAIPTFFLGAERRPDIAVPNSSKKRPETALERDGLDQFDDTLFLDPEIITDVTTENLLAKADFISYQHPDPPPLKGIHAALAVEEATIIAVPDAVHLGWTSIYDGGDPQDPSAPTPQPPVAQSPAPTFHNCAVAPATPAPVLTQPQPKIQPGSYTLSWTAVGTAQQTVRYTLQESTNRDFAGAS